MSNIYLDKYDKDYIVLKKHFSNPTNFNELYNLYLGKILLDPASSLEIDLLENEFENACHDKEHIDKNIIENAMQFYKQLVGKVLNSNETVSYLLSYLLLSNDYFPEFIRDNKLLENLKQKELICKKTIQKLANKYLEGNPLTTQEYEFLFSVSFKDNDINDLERKIFKKLIEVKSNTVYNFYELKFICEYVNKKQSHELNYDVAKVYYGQYIPIFNVKTGKVEKTKWNSISNAGAASDYGIIINRGINNTLTIQSIKDVIVITSHESLHMKQRNDFLKGKITLESIANGCQLQLYDSYDSYDLYKVNYDFHENEFQANYQSYITLNELKEKYSINFDISYYNELLNKLIINHSYAMIIPNPKDPNSEIQLLEEYIPQAMESIFKKKPDLLDKKEYASFNWFYNKDGTLKKHEELKQKFFSLSETRKKELIQIFIPFLSHAINNENNFSLTPDTIKILNILKQYEEEQLEIMENGREIFQNNIDHHLRLLDKRFENTAEMLIEKRKKKLQRYKLLLSPKQNENKQSENKRDDDKFDENLEAFQSKYGLFDWNNEQKIIETENQKRRNNGKKTYISTELIFEISNFELGKGKISNERFRDLMDYDLQWNEIIEIYKKLHNYNEMSDIEKSVFDKIGAKKHRMLLEELKRPAEQIKIEHEKKKYDYIDGDYDIEGHHRKY